MALGQAFLIGCFQPCQESLKVRFATQKALLVARSGFMFMQLPFNVVEVVDERKPFECFRILLFSAAGFDGFIKPATSMSLIREVE